MAFSFNWWIPGNRTSRAVVGTLILVVFVMISYGIVRTMDKNLKWWETKQNWLHRGIHPVLSSHLANAKKQFMEFMEFVRMTRGRRDSTHEPQSDIERVDLASMGTPGNFSQAIAERNAPTHSTFYSNDPSSFQPGTDDQENHPNPPVSKRNASVVSFLPLHNDISIMSPSDSRTNTGSPSGLSSSQQIEDAQIILQDQSRADARSGPDGNRGPIDKHVTTRPCSTSEGMVGTANQARSHSDALPTNATSTSDSGGQTEAVATDTATLILSSPLCAEEPGGVKYAKHVVEEPRELEQSPQPSPSSKPPPKICAKSATADYFHYAPVAAQWTLDDHDIEECKDSG